MSLEYAERRIKEALKLARGNPVKARQQVIAWTFEDSKLLYALTKHHLSGIVAYHIERVASGRASQSKAPPPPKPEKAPVKQDDEFGMEILKAVANSSSAVFGLEGYAAPRKRGQASQQHIDAIRQMAARSKGVNGKNPKKQ